ncbi:hypothetical protein QQ045_030705 [Rhodiola kirilowii]
MVKRSWFTNHLAQIPVDADDETLKKYARAYLLNLIGLTLFSDNSGKTIPLYFLPLLEDMDMVRNYSWGSAMLACLYSNTCGACTILHSQLAGAPLIIQFWAWDRLSRIGAQKITVPVMLLPADAEFEPALRLAWSYLKWVGPKRWVGVPHGSLLQYRDAIRKMQPARVASQYGFRQGVLPNPIGSSDQFHGMERKKNRDRAFFHASYIALWVTRHERLLDGDMGDPYANIDEATAQYVVTSLVHVMPVFTSSTARMIIRVGFHDIFHHLYTEVGKLTDPAIVGVDPDTITLDMADLDIRGEEDIDTHVDDAIDDQYRPSSSSQ